MPIQYLSVEYTYRKGRLDSWYLATQLSSEVIFINQPPATMTSQPPPRIVTTDIDANVPSQPQSISPTNPHTFLAPAITSATPSSPTLSASSESTAVRFDSPPRPTTLALRDNHPTAASGADTLGVGHPGGASQGHRRLSSVGTWSSAEFDDEGKRNPAWPPLPEKERLAAELSWREKRQEKKQAKADMSDEKKAALDEVKNQSAHLDPDNDTTDPTPFKDTPSRLAMLVDPKSLVDLEKIGGIQGVLDGLGVNPRQGLITGGAKSGAEAGGSGPQWNAAMEKRLEVYGRNELPKRKGKSLFYLMWMALKDKVLVSIFISQFDV